MSLNINSMLSLNKQRKTMSLPFDGRESYGALFRSRQNRSSIQDIQIHRLQRTTSKIQFCYRGGNNQYAFNKQLKLTNKTGTLIGFKIKSNNPQNYEVTPSEQIIQNDSVCQIRIRLYIQDPIIQKYFVDRFMIEWGAVNQQMQVQYTNNTILNVEVKTTVSTIKQRPTIKNLKQLKDQILTYQQVKVNNTKKIDKLQKQLKQLQSVSKPWTISMPVGFVLAVLSFSFGYIIF